MTTAPTRASNPDDVVAQDVTSTPVVAEVDVPVVAVLDVPAVDVLDVPVLAGSATATLVTETVIPSSVALAWISVVSFATSIEDLVKTGLLTDLGKATV